MNRKIEELVLEAYTRDPNTVNDDKYLIPAVWKLEGWDDDDSLFRNFRKVSNPESITRARRKLHEDGFIKYSEKATERRMKEYKEATEKFGKSKVYFDKETNTARIL